MDELFEELKTILSQYSSQLTVVHDEPGYYYLETNKKDEKGKPYFFGMVKVGAKKVSFHLMPIYCDPSLVEEISSDLKNRMQGKSCFNFTKQQSELAKELTSLTEKCIESYKTDGKI